MYLILFTIFSRINLTTRDSARYSTNHFVDCVILLINRLSLISTGVIKAKKLITPELVIFSSMKLLLQPFIIVFFGSDYSLR